MLGHKKTAVSGFTLIEISLVIVIIAILVGMAVFSTKARMDASKVFLTKQRMQTIMDTMDRFIEDYGFVPCPVNPTISRSDDNYGLGTCLSNDGSGVCQTSTDEDCNLAVVSTTGTSHVKMGGVPFKVLGLDSQTAVDGWGNRFDYIVSEKHTSRTFFTHTTGDLPGWDETTPDSFSIMNKARDEIDQNNEVVYILISHGPNGYGGISDKTATASSTASASSFEVENSDLDDPDITVATYYQFQPDKDSDDIVVFKTLGQLPKFINGD